MCQLSPAQAAALWPGVGAQQASAAVQGPVVALQLLGEGMRLGAALCRLDIKQAGGDLTWQEA